jgi:hypothetical protein
MKKIFLFIALIASSAPVLVAQFASVENEIDEGNVTVGYDMKKCFLRPCCKLKVGWVCIVRDQDLPTIYL